jgi:hypothetical protein
LLKTFIDKGVIVDGEALSINAKDSHGKTALIQAFSRVNVRFRRVKSSPILPVEHDGNHHR